MSVTSGRQATAWSIIVGLLGTALVWQITPFGAGLSPDSVSYVTAARWALAGQGVRSLEGGPLVHFPPLYPVLLAVAGQVSGSDPLEAARCVNAALFAVLLGLACLLAARIGRRGAAGVAAALVLVVSRDTVLLHAMAWSEPLAIVLGTVGLVLVARHIETGRIRLLTFGAIALGLAALTRYAAVGYALAAATALLLLDRATPRIRRVAEAVGLAAVAAGPLVIWWRSTGARLGLGDRTLNFHPLGRWDVTKVAGTLSAWVGLPNAPGLGSGVFVLVATGLGVWLLRLGGRRALTDNPLAALLLWFAAVYVGLIVVCRLFVDAAILFDTRILAPAHVALTTAGAGLVARALPDPVPRRARLALWAAGLAFVTAHVAATARWAREARADGLFYTRRGLQKSALLAQVRALPPTAVVWSNAPDAVYIHTGRCARLLPGQKRPDNGRPDPAFASGWRELLGQRDAYIAWFDAFAWRSYLPAERELAAAPSIQTVMSLDDGRLYRIASSGPESVAAGSRPACPPAPLARAASGAPVGAPPSPALARTAGDREAAMGWAHYGGDAGGMRYSPLGDIDRTKVGRLKLAWTWRTGEHGRQAEAGSILVGLGKFEATPLMFGDTLFLTTPNHRAVALDAETGLQLWAFDPRAHERDEARVGHRFVHRGLAAWSGGGRRRLFYASRGRLYALDAATGGLVPEVGDSGVVDLLKAMGWSGNPDHVDNTSPATVYQDLVIVGTSVSDDVSYPGDPPGAVLAFDARSGRLRWIFRTIPHAGEPGSQTWVDGTGGAGHANVWSPMTVDTARGLLYLPVSAASNDYYGGRRHGADLFAESLVCLDARTGKRVWHFQTVHHGLWDYDLPGPPVLATVRRGARTQDIVAVAGKTGFVYVFDRVTGKPVWPIVERPVPPSEVPGEAAAPTQPVPTRPAPFVQQGFSEEDLVDFTPLLRDSVRALLHGVRFGPVFTPPSLGGSVVMPGPIGGAAWGGPAYDPESELLIVKGNNQPSVVWLAPPDPPGGATDARFMPLLRRGWRWPGGGEQELPFGKPPYGTLTAIDLATGDQRWQVTVGNWPELTGHPAVRGVKLPPVGAVGTSGPIVTGGGLVFISGGSTSLHALDVTTGKELWEGALGGRGEANPMTYRTRSGRQFVVIASSQSRGGALLAFALSRP